MTTHTCPYPGCQRELPASLLACKLHWRLLPKQLRDPIWSTYNRGLSLDHPERAQALKDVMQFYRDHAREWSNKAALSLGAEPG